MDLLQEINDVVRSNLNFEDAQVQNQQPTGRWVKKFSVQETFNFWQKLSEETASKEEIQNFFRSRHYR